jgi:predicted permease
MMSKEMKFTEAWKLSQIPYQELVFKSFIKSRGISYISKTQLSDGKSSNEKMIRRVIRSAVGNKIVVALIIAVASFISFIQSEYQYTTLSILIGSSLSLLMIFGYTLLYEIQFLPSMLDEQPTELLYSLPIYNSDISYILILAFIRAMDFIIIVDIAVPSLLVLILTHSLLASFIEMIGAITSVALATGLAIYLSKIFYQIANREKRSRTESIVRLMFTVVWGALVMSLALLYNYNTYLTPSLEKIITESSMSSILILSSIPSFSFSFLISSTLGGKSYVASYAAIGFSALYVGLSVLVILWSLRTIATFNNLHHDTNRKTPRDLKLVLRGQTVGYSIKDFRIASRNPTTAFLLAAPVLEAAIVLFPLITANVVGTITVLVGTVIGGIFTCFVVIGLLTAEGTGIEYTRTLPLSTNKIMHSKAFTATISYIPVPVIFALLGVIKPAIFNFISLIPLWELPAVAAAALVEMMIIVKSSGEERVLIFNLSSSILYFIASILVSCLVLGLPLVSFILTNLILGQKIASEIVLALVSSAEFIIMMHLTNVMNYSR